jgi:hypothetical protein
MVHIWRKWNSMRDLMHSNPPNIQHPNIWSHGPAFMCKSPIYLNHGLWDLNLFHIKGLGWTYLNDGFCDLNILTFDFPSWQRADIGWTLAGGHPDFYVYRYKSWVSGNFSHPRSRSKPNVTAAHHDSPARLWKEWLSVPCLDSERTSTLQSCDFESFWIIVRVVHAEKDWNQGKTDKTTTKSTCRKVIPRRQEINGIFFSCGSCGKWESTSPWKCIFCKMSF